MNFMTFHILGIIIPTDELIFFNGGDQPPTSEKMGNKAADLFWGTYRDGSNP